MATKIRLQRKGRKGYPFYHIVIADSRAPRDGRFIEKIGTYNPNVEPIAIEVNMERALYWLGVGAEPTDTTRNLLSSEGVLMKKHLLGGVAKGAFSAEEAEKRFEAWMAEKGKAAAAVSNKKDAAEKAAAKARLEAEQAINKAKAEAVAKKQAEANVAAAEAEAEVVEEAPAAETTEEEKAAE